MKRVEAVALVKELGGEHLIRPSFVIIEQRKPDSYQLKIKGDYDIPQIELLVKNKFAVQENIEKGFLVIFEP